MGEANEEEGYPITRVETVDARDTSGKPLKLAQREHDGSAVFADQPNLAVVGIDYLGAYWGQTSKGEWKEGPLPNSGSLGVVRFDKHLLAFVRPGADLAALPAVKLQIRPLQDPMTLKQGDVLKVRVTWNGKPLAGAELIGDFVGATHRVSARTDAKGEASIEVRNQGLNVIGLLHYEPSASDPKANFIEHLATLSFALGVQEEPGHLHPTLAARR